MKVLHTIPYFNKASGGPTSCVYQLAKGLVQNDVNCTVLSFLPNEDDILANDSFINYLPDDRHTPLWLSRNMSRKLKDTVSDYDLIHVNTIWTWPSHIPVAEARKKNVPVIISPHGMLYPQALKVSAWKKKISAAWYVNNDLKNAVCLHATSEAEAKHIRNYGLKNPIAIIPNCIDISVYPEPRSEANDHKVFGFTGRLNPIKNIDMLLKAWNELGEKTTDTELVIIGDGDPEYAAQLKAYVADNNMKNVSFTGFLSGDQLHQKVRSLDYLILPSKSENFGMVVPEALICGVPAIASKGTPWKSLEDNNCGWWVDTNVESLKKAMSTCLDQSENERIIMGANGRRHVIDSFSLDAVANQMKQLYNWVLKKGEKPSFVYY